MKVEKFEPQRHYEMVAHWWVGHKWPVLPLAALPASGFVVPGVCAGFLYFTDSEIAILEWVVSNPKASTMEVGRGIKAIVEAAISTALNEGYSMIFSYVKSKGLQKLYERQGFKVTDDNMTHVLWRA